MDTEDSTEALSIGLCSPENSPSWAIVLIKRDEIRACNKVRVVFSKTPATPARGAEKELLEA